MKFRPAALGRERIPIDNEPRILHTCEEKLTVISDGLVGVKLLKKKVRNALLPQCRKSPYNEGIALT